MHAQSTLVIQSEIHVSSSGDYLHVFAKGNSDFDTTFKLWQDIGNAMRQYELKRVLIDDQVDSGLKADLDVLRLVKKIIGADDVPIDTRIAHT